MLPDERMPDEAARQALVRLARWLRADAYPIWSQHGWDARLGGFHERLTAGGPVPGEARRARVQLRQIYSFARASGLGWQDNAGRLVAEGLTYFFARYRRPDGLARTLITSEGSVADDRALLYDQAFALLAFAQAHQLLGAGQRLREAAEALLERIYEAYKCAGLGFRSQSACERPLSSNAHMHLLESALEWRFLSEDPRWGRLVEELLELALDHLIDARTGVLREYFDLAGAAYAGAGGRLVEPGHQFEWAWLLLRAGGGQGTASGPAASAREVCARLLTAAARLMELGEAHGVRDGVAINSLLDDMTVNDPQARLWPQTERLKAHALMARLTGDPRHWHLAGEAAQALERYLDTGVRGLWYDRRLPDGSFVAEPSPASSFYHIVCAIGELASALETQPRRQCF